MPRSKKLSLLDSLSQHKTEYTPIYFDNGETQYTSDDVRLCVEDYYRSAEKTIIQNRKDLNEIHKNDIDPNFRKNVEDDVPHTPEQLRVAEIKASGDYYFIIQVAKSRNELDLMRDMRIKLHSIDKDTGFSKIDLIQNRICDLVSKPCLSYQEMAQIRFDMNTLKDINEQPSTNVNIGQLNAVLNQSSEKTEKIAESIKEPSLKEIRSQALQNNSVDAEFTEK